MGQQIIKQPDGQFAVFDTGSDTIIVWDGTRDEIVRWFVDRAVAATTRLTNDLLDHVDAGNTRKAYAQFAMTWDEALVTDKQRGGDAWRYFQ
jgi:hypothetical protein